MPTGPSAGYISLRASIFQVGPTFKRITAYAKGDAIKIVQEQADTTIVEGSLGDATFIISESKVRRIELMIVPSSDNVTLLMGLRKARIPFPWKFEFGPTKVSGFWAIDKDCDIVVSDSGPPTMIGGPAWCANINIGAQGVGLV